MPKKNSKELEAETAAVGALLEAVKQKGADEETDRLAPLVDILDRLRIDSVGRLQIDARQLLNDREDLRADVPKLWAAFKKDGY